MDKWHRERVEWKFVLANSSTMVNIGELNASNKQLELVLNRAGSASFKMDIKDAIADQVKVIETCIKAYRITPTSTNLVWSGPIWNIEDIIHQDSMQVSAVGWFELLNHRYLRYEKIYSGSTWAAGAIALDLLTIANNQKDGPTSVGFPDGNGTTRPTGIAVGSNSDTQIRNVTFPQWQSIGQAITEYGDVENGYDFEITPDTKTLNTYSSAFPGTLRRDRPQAQFGYQWGPHNLLEFARTTEANTIVNSQFAAGKDNQLALSQNTTSMGTYGLFEDAQVINNVGDINVLQAFASAEVSIKSFPKVVYKILPHPYGPDHTHVPEPFVDYRVGDHVYLTANVPPRISVNKQLVRVYAIGITIDEEGWEKVSSLQVSPN